ncbi:MAG: pilus assembly protein [Pseudomonadota bacterium]|nr:pilus assembly protein [Pseudomonadota bacterium]
MSAPPPCAPKSLSFLAADDGIAAVEMAFIAPVALILLTLAVAAGQCLTTYHKVVLAAHTSTDLVARTAWNADPSVAGAELLPLSGLNTDIGVSQLVMYPENTTNLRVVISEFQINPSTKTGTLVWSYSTSNTTPLPQGTKISLDPNLAATGATYVVYGTVSYNFQPFGGILSLPPITLSSTETLTIRNATQITIDPTS